MNMTAKSLTAHETTQERTPLMSVDKLQNAQRNVENAEPKENKESTNKTSETQMTTEEVKEVVESFQEMSETIQTKLSFSVDEENNEIVVKIFDKESEELIRQFPSDEMLSLQDKMSDLAGFLFDQQV
ncbi:flagellar protein FlaG [uncultured Desulfobacter sp.]|uniref:flagellar protein FlaG n=1 Tax=uncultured Desulfobacter sp. TaxID=240139 RepID=UPI0029F51D7A|nr:flagellar protein FlaG [uncultured Desulfobacter sp.]